MLRYALNRLFMAVPTLLIVAVVVFTLMRMVSGDPAQLMLGDLESPEAMTAEYPVEHGRTNPFLHLSMHLAIAEQLSIDHPRGIRAAYQRMVGRGDAHQAAHEIMECLGQVVW